MDNRSTNLKSNKKLHNHIDIIFLQNEAIDIKTNLNIPIFLFDDGETLSVETPIDEIRIACIIGSVH